MQKSTVKTEAAMMSIPADMLIEAGIYAGDAVQMYADGKKLVIENINAPEDFICGGDCVECPFCDVACDGECCICPCRFQCEKDEDVVI